MHDTRHAHTSSERSTCFRRRFFPAATERQWNDWRWQLRNRTGVEISRLLRLSEDERAALIRGGSGLSRITPYYASLLDPDDPGQSLRRSVVARTSEFLRAPGEAVDPLDEDSVSPVPGIVHRYPDRVLFVVTSLCAAYCRYCTRGRLVNRRDTGTSFGTRLWERAVEYIAATPTIRDVLISGGDPLILSDERLEWLLRRLRAIRHVEFLRIGTKTPAVLPQRITRGLVSMLKQFHPLWLSLHFTHPDELTREAADACARLADSGLPLGSQTVLLAGVNDDVATLKALFHGLLKLRVRPYYLYQCDPVVGSAAFRVPVEKGLEIMRGLWGHTTGYAVPAYVVDAPGGGGKVPLPHNQPLQREGDFILLRNHEGRIFRYPESGGAPANEARPASG